MNTTNLSGHTLGGYQLLELLGKGGMGAVYRAHKSSLRKRYVALKVISPSLMDQPGVLERFDLEAEIAAGLEHEHIIPIYDYDTQEGISYVVMRLLNGGSLADRLSSATHLMPIGEVLTLLHPLADALDYAHSQDVIHRDLKPANVLFSKDGTLFLVDFGLAKLTNNPSEQFTKEGSVVGTPAYMAPEQWQGEKIGIECDLYALGILTYTLLTGFPPFIKASPYEYMHDHLFTPVPSILTRRPELPPATQDVLNCALAKKAEARYPSAREFVSTLETALGAKFLASPTRQINRQLLDEPTYQATIPTDPAIPVPEVSDSLISQMDKRRHWKFWLMGLGVIFVILSILLSVQTGLFSSSSGGPTPLAGRPAATGEMVVVVADFNYEHPNATKIEGHLEAVLNNTEFRVVRISHPILSEEQAQVVMDVYNASVVIYGESSPGGVEIYFAITQRAGSLQQEIFGFRISNTDVPDLDAYIFEGMDSEYISAFIGAQLLYSQSSYDEAVIMAERAVASLPQERADLLFGEFAYYLLARAYIATGNIQGVSGTITALSEKFPDSPYKDVAQGDLLASQGQYQPAVDAYTTALATDPALVSALAGRSRAYTLMGNLKMARDDAETLLGLKPNNMEALYNHAIVLAFQDKPDAGRDCKKIQELYPATSEGSRCWGQVYLAWGEISAAVYHYALFLNDNPQDRNALSQRAIAYSYIKEGNLARADCDQILTIYPELPDGNICHARTNLYFGSREAGAEYARQALLLQPNAVEALYVLGVSTSDQTEGLKACNDMIAIGPASGQAYLCRATVYLRMGESELAKADLEQAANLGVTDPTINIRFVELYLTSDYLDCSQATTYLNKYLNELPPFLDLDSPSGDVDIQARWRATCYLISAPIR